MIDESYRAQPHIPSAWHTEHTGESEWPGGKPHRRKFGPFIRITYEGNDRINWRLSRRADRFRWWLYDIRDAVRDRFA